MHTHTHFANTHIHIHHTLNHDHGRVVYFNHKHERMVRYTLNRIIEFDPHESMKIDS